jgi:hypothetical protein
MLTNKQTNKTKQNKTKQTCNSCITKPLVVKKFVHYDDFTKLMGKEFLSLVHHVRVSCYVERMNVLKLPYKSKGKKKTIKFSPCCAWIFFGYMLPYKKLRKKIKIFFSTMLCLVFF